MEELRQNSEAKEYSPNLYEVVYSPLLQRDEYQEEPIRSKLLKLLEIMGAEEFNTYINPLLRVNYNGRAVMLITRKEMHKTMIEGKHLPAIKEAFEVDSIRVVSQA